MAKTCTGADVGARSAVAIRGAWKGGTFHVSNYAAGDNDQGTVDAGWASLQADFKLGATRIAASGREVNVRYTRVPGVPDWQLRNLMRFEVQEIGDQSGAEVASDFNLLPRPPEIDGEDVVLLAMARESLLEEHMDGVEVAGGAVEAFSPASIGLYNAFMRYGVVEDDTVLLANIGHETTDVVLVRGSDLVFARNLTGGSGLFDDALVQRLQLSAARAEATKIDHVDLTPGARHATAEGEKATRAVMAAAGQLTSLLQSAVMFCKSQVKLTGLKVDRVLVCGGGAALQGLPRYLSSGMGVPVELFDPFRVVDTSALAPEAADHLARHQLESVIALGMATMASDPDAYSLEIVPEALAKKRAFLGGTVWLIAAAVLAVAFLGYRVTFLTQKLDQLTGESRGLSSILARARDIHSETEELVAENTRLVAETVALQGIAGSGEQLARAIAFLDDRLPPDFWITRVESAFGTDSEIRVERGSERPILTVRGQARDGVQSPTSQFQQLVADLEETMPYVSLRADIDRNKFNIHMTSFADAPDETGEEDDGSQ
ncbi:MAG: pilus assembly protein PilM [Planctomycetota bacterium]|nr:pilus assembly protein PilM [Planctomycetota bacterium]MDG1984464.1 pilus assembly protein PilM [Planctomycetota bacterium]